MPAWKSSTQIHFAMGLSDATAQKIGQIRKSGAELSRLWQANSQNANLSSQIESAMLLLKKSGLGRGRKKKNCK